MGLFISNQGVSISYKTFSVISKGYKRITPVFLAFWMGILCLLMAVAASVWNKGFHPSATTLIIAPFGGLCFATASMLYIHILATGPFIWSVMMLNLSGFITTLYSLVFLGEVISLPQTAGMLFILSILAVMSVKSRSGDRPFTVRWMIMGLITMVTNSGVFCAMKTQNHLMNGAETLEYLTLAFMFTAIFALAFHLLTRDKTERPPYRAFLPPAFGLVGSIGSVSIINMALMKRVPAAVQFPVATGCGIVLSTIVSMVLYRERPGWRLYLSAALLLAGVTLLGL